MFRVDARRRASIARLRTTPPDRLAGFEVTVTDLLHEHGSLRSDALVFFGGDEDDWVRMVVRPSGTEPKVKSYIEVRCANLGNIDGTRVKARAVADDLAGVARQF